MAAFCRAAIEASQRDSSSAKERGVAPAVNALAEFCTRFIMTHTLRSITILASLFAGTAITPALADNAVPTAPTELSPASGNNCTNGEVIDGSTAEQAIAKFQAAGYSNVQIIEKGCDNFWHATGVKGGQGGNIVLSPEGAVMPEGN
jgi:hypothetical protein